MFICITPSKDMLLSTLALTRQLCQIAACTCTLNHGSFKDKMEPFGYQVIPVDIVKK